MLCNYPMSTSEIYGGTSTVAYNLVNCLIKYTDVKIITFTFVPGIKKKQYYNKDKQLSIIRYPAKFKFSSITNCYRQKKVFKKFLKENKIDIIHSQCTSVYTKLAVNSNLPNVFTVHGIRLKEIEMVRNKIGYLRYSLTRRTVLENYRKATNIVVTNRYTKEQINPYHKASIWEIRNPIDETYFDLYQKKRIEPGNILMASGIRRRKDIITAILAVKKILEYNKDIVLVLNITGPEESDYKKEVLSIISNLGLKNNIHIHGLVSEEEIKYLYSIADIVLLTSLEETSPMALIQAVASGKPIVTTNVGGVSEIVIENKNSFIVNVKDYHNIAVSILKLLNDRKLRDNFAANSYKIARQNWSTKGIALKTYDMYKTILNIRDD